MRKSRIYVHLIPAVLSVAFLLADLSWQRERDGTPARTAPGAASSVTELESGSPSGNAPSGLRVALRAASGATIAFTTQNGSVVGGAPPVTREIPYLQLYHNDSLTAPAARTLIVEAMDIEVPPPGVTVTLRVETQHGDPDQATDSPPGIVVWRETRRLTNTTSAPQLGVSMTWEHEFEGTLLSGTDAIATPTDYFRYELIVSGPPNVPASSWPVLHGDYAFLMENQWIVPLPDVPEQSPGAAPDELVVYYCDMFSVRHDRLNANTWLLREDLPRYLRTLLAPAFVDAYRLQSAGWGFPWYEEWTAYRPGADAHRLSVALSDGQTWFHGEAPYQGNAAMTINVSGSKVEYAALTDGLMRVFHHELFHAHQRNLYLHYGGSGDIGGLEDAWAFFSEGTAVLAASVAQSTVQFERTRGLRSYMANARAFIGQEGFIGGGLDRSYEQISPYSSAMYWRFLYEQCGGMAGGLEDAAAGMQVIRQALVTLYSGEVVDIASSAEMVEQMPVLVNRILAGASCPFDTHEAALQAFARAIYALRLDGGRCFAPNRPAGCGLYDPNTLYPNPPVDTIDYGGGVLTYGQLEQRFRPGIPGSFGIDLVDIALHPDLDGQPLTLDFISVSGAEFAVQVWRLMAPGDGSKPRPVATEGTVPEVLVAIHRDGHQAYTIPAIDTSRMNRLGLAITRTDSREGSDPWGSYTIVLRQAGPEPD